MADETNGSETGNVVDLVPELLRGIRDELRGLREDVGALRDETRGGFAALSARIDKVIENTGAHWRDLEARVTALERGAGRS